MMEKGAVKGGAKPADEHVQLNSPIKWQHSAASSWKTSTSKVKDDKDPKSGEKPVKN